MWELVRAESVPPADSAVLPCGCLGAVLSHDDAFVHFGIEHAACRRHAPSSVAVVDKNALVMPTKPVSGG